MTWEEDESNKCELLYKLENNYNFGDANMHTDKVLEKLKQALNDGGNEDFDDDFNDYNESPQKKNKGKGGETKLNPADKKNQENKFQVTSVGWSCNGAMLAVAYGKTDHVSWCEHQSIISVWRIFTRDLDTK